jgi:Flp pilus assembly protein TadG
VSATAHPPPRDDGQAAVELALALPVVALLLLAVIQLAVVVRDAVVVTHAAREAARAAAVSSDPVGSGRRAAIAAAGPLRADRLVVVITEGSGRVTADLRYRAPTDVPLIGALVADADVHGRATMQVEP